jgi:hypothetical protein
LNRCIVNLLRGPFGGVGAKGVLGAGSLILIPDAFLFMAFRDFFGEGGVVVALCLSARVQVDTALGPTDELSVDPALGVRAEIGMARIG